MYASIAVSHARLPPLAALGLLPGPCRPLGGPSLLVPPSIVPPPLPPHVILGVLLSFGSWYLLGWPFLRAKARGPGVPTPWNLLVPGHHPPPLLDHSGTDHSTSPPPLPPLFPPRYSEPNCPYDEF